MVTGGSSTSQGAKTFFSRAAYGRKSVVLRLLTTFPAPRQKAIIRATGDSPCGKEPKGMHTEAKKTFIKKLREIGVLNVDPGCIRRGHIYE